MQRLPVVLLFLRLSGREVNRVRENEDHGLVAKDGLLY
jgi:hypothetical protein